MHDMSMIATVVILVIAMGLFISGKLRADIVALCTLAALLVTGLLKPEQAMYGFTNQAVATIAAMFVISAGLVHTGLLQWAAPFLDRIAGKGETQLILVLCIVIALLSAFLVNTATVAIFIPVAIVLARSRNIAPSRVLIPLSFASQFGGVCTIIGSSTNMLVNGIGISRGMRSFGFFEFAPLGLIMVAAGTVYLLLTSRWLLPKRKGEADTIDKYRLSDYLAELQVQGNSLLAGKTWEQSKVGRETGVELANLIREDKAVTRPSNTKIRPGDLLLLHGNIDKIMAMEQKYCLELLKNSKVRDNQLKTHDIQLIEGLIPPGSNLIGSTLRTSAFLRRYKSIILALQRRGNILKERLGDIVLESGDNLLIQAHRDDVSHLMSSANIVVTSELSGLQFRRDRAIAALIILVAVVFLAAFNVVSIMVAALVGALFMVLTRCVTIGEAYQAIDWKIVFLLGGIIPLGLALEQSGTILWFAEKVLQPFLAYGPIALLAALYLTTAVLTEMMSNNAAAAILAPVAIILANSINVDARPFLVAITFAASTSFATPIGYQTNTMVYSAGGYRFTDFTRIGIPLNIIFWILATLLIPVFWPF